MGQQKLKKNSVLSKRSLYIAEDIFKGDILTKKTLRVIRPGLGLPPKYYDLLLGKKVNRDIKMGSPVKWDMIKF